MSTPEQHHPLKLPDRSGAVPTSTEARAKCCIAMLKEQLETMKQERAMKQRLLQWELNGPLLEAPE
ncbi:hypothetical protein DEU56DRAFT_908419 [Suillus clintonianus]|uniref:uncharacterized protein n=1 Tax=Suillus clintonianus TaxID=1904413 RepID=UPI001B884751|nr:uncharacterized protein DEU56DRAFT_908419 [Suillus clintonianus]KAG2150780.1 hypothetical protein DEU56DRAFT_908419 [Suillus clintonianus]